jgi:predicted nucleic acid-binding protein
VIAVSDSSPLHYLILLGRADLLHVLLGDVVIPQSVRQELECAGAPASVREWFKSVPSWARVHAAKAVDWSLPLGKGEREAIGLAQELRADVLLLDDKKARRFAQQHGLAVAGTLAILRVAHGRGLVQLRNVISELRTCGFRISEKVAQQVCFGVADEPARTGETLPPSAPPV